MGKDYKRKSARGAYGEEKLQQALVALQGGQSYHRVAKDFDIPRRTLQRHYKGAVLQPGKQHLGRFRAVLNQDFESELVAHILELQQRFYGITPMDLRRLAYQVAEKEKLRHPFNKMKQMAGRKWLKEFLYRHPELSVREPEATSMCRAVAFNKPQVQRFFDLLQAEFQKIGGTTGLRADQIYNMDESGLTAVHNPGRIIARKGQKQVGKITSGERGKTVTVICTANAAGTFVPPLMIFPRKNMTNLLIKDAPPGTVGAASITGWTDSTIFCQWLRHFIEYVKPTTARPVILLLDGHASHKTLEGVELARKNNIAMVSFPPHTTHRLQPLDKCFFGPLKTYYNSACDNWMSVNAGKRIGFYDIAGLFKTAYFKAAMMQRAVNGFQSCGIFPLDPQIFSDDDFAPSLLTDEGRPRPNWFSAVAYFSEFWLGLYFIIL